MLDFPDDESTVVNETLSYCYPSYTYSYGADYVDACSPTSAANEYPVYSSSSPATIGRSDTIRSKLSLSRPASASLKSNSKEAPVERSRRNSELTLPGDGAATPSKPEVRRHENGLQDQTNFLPASTIIVCFLGMGLAIFLSFLDQTIVSTSLPTISLYFNAGRDSAWVASAYLLTSTAFQPVLARLSDILGRKFTLLLSVFIFLVGSLACALSRTMTELIIFRALQGVGGGGLMTLVMIVIGDIVNLRDRGKYQGINEAIIAIANGVGPVIGGALAQVNWRWCFWINLPVGAVTIIVITLFLPLKRVRGNWKEKLAQIDGVGALLTLVAACLILLPLNWGGVTYEWASGPVLGTLLAGLVIAVVLIYYESRFPKIPMIPHTVFKHRTTCGVFVITFLGGASMFSQVYYLPQYLQVVQGVSPIRSGVLVIPQLVTTTVFVFISGQVVARTGEYKPSLILGYCIWSVGLGLLSTLSESTSTAKFIGYSIIAGTGQGQTLQTALVAAQAAVPRSEMAPTTAFRNFLRSLGATVGLAISAAILNNSLRSALAADAFSNELIASIIDKPTGLWSPSVPELFNLPTSDKSEIVLGWVRGFHVAFLVYACLVASCAFVSLFVIQRHSLTREDDAALKAEGKAWLAQRGHKGGVDSAAATRPVTPVNGLDDAVKEKKAEQV